MRSLVFRANDLVQDLSVRALFARNENDHVVRTRELPDLLVPARHLTTDGVFCMELNRLVLDAAHNQVFDPRPEMISYRVEGLFVHRRL